ncbi:zinc finger protein 208-like [Acanthaster planci]|uniref:Zinc finger protein 208-like n=1 Tax=Acanthaster planci TaxID=133434 RepID=A0A8B7YL96_ACAPL|nr:zinc finger protein 208-like [Acanthaster planci]
MASNSASGDLVHTDAALFDKGETSLHGVMTDVSPRCIVALSSDEERLVTEDSTLGVACTCQTGASCTEHPLTYTSPEASSTCSSAADTDLQASATGPPPFKCNICDEIFSRQKTLWNHKLIHFDVNTVRCTVCSKTFRTSADLKEHSRIHSKEGSFNCDLCGEAFRTRSALLKHQTSNHSGGSSDASTSDIRKKQKKEHVCPYCSKAFKGKTHLEEHERIHTNEKPFACQKCGKAFSRKNTLTRHIATHSENRKPFLCHKCGIFFQTYYSLRKHRQLHKDRPHVCRFCKKTFSTPKHLQKHLQKHRKDEYICRCCNKRFQTHFKLMRHRESHQTKQRTYKCVDCSRLFKTATHLQKHQKSTHKPKGSHVCRFCQESFKKTNDLNLHIRSHAKARRGGRALAQKSPKDKYRCGICSNSFETYYRMRQHKQMHQERPFMCDICEETFLTGIDLSEHKKTECTDAFNCEMCQKTFTSQTALQCHQIKHVIERPYMCSVCLKSFKSTSHLKAHMLSHADGKFYTCAICDKGFKEQGSLQRHQQFCQNRRPSERPETSQRTSGVASMTYPVLCRDGVPVVNQPILQTFVLNPGQDLQSIECLQPSESVTIPRNVSSSVQSVHRSFEQAVVNSVALLDQSQSVPLGISFNKQSGNCVHLSHATILGNEVHVNGEVDMQRNPSEGESPLRRNKSAEVAPSASTPSRCQESYSEGRDVLGEAGAESSDDDGGGGEFALTDTSDEVDEVVLNRVCTEVLLPETFTENSDDSGVISHQLVSAQQHFNLNHPTLQLVINKIQLFTCHVCKRDFQSSIQLNQHKLCHQEDNPNVRIPTDGSTNHQTGHTKTLSCSFCGKDFHRRSRLQEHERIHTKEKPYKCTKCGKEFSHKSSLRGHETAIHGMTCPQRPRNIIKNCDICGKTFKGNSYFKRHMATHSSERPYKCERCDKAYKQKCHLSVHQVNCIGTDASKSAVVPEPSEKPDGTFNNYVATRGASDVISVDKLKDLKSCSGTDDTHPTRITRGSAARAMQNLTAECMEQEHGKKELSSKSLKTKELSGEKNSQTPNLHVDEALANYSQSSTEHALTSEVGGDKVQTKITSDSVSTSPAEAEGSKIQLSASVGPEGATAVMEAATEDQVGTSKRRTVTCRFCGKFCGFRARLLEHERVHTKERPFKCDKCEKTFAYGSVLRSHRITVHKMRISPRGIMKTKMMPHLKDADSNDVDSKCSILQCSICHQEFQSAALMKQHRSQAHKENRPYQCDLCDKGYFAKAHLKEHHVRAHSNTRNFKCPVCLKGFRTKSDCTRHKQTHRARLKTGNPSSANIDPVMEPKNEQARDKETVLGAHQPWKSGGNKLTTCRICHKSFRFVTLLKEHIKQLHGEERPFQCDMCKKTYYTISHLKEHHIRAHTNSRDFICPICQKRFCRKSDLNQHRRTRCCEPSEANPSASDYRESTGTCESKQLFTPSGETRLVSCSTHYSNDTSANSNSSNIEQPSSNEPVWDKVGTMITAETAPEAETCRSELQSSATGHSEGASPDTEIVYKGQQGTFEKKSVTCRFCGKFCGFRARLLEHERVHTKERPFKCDKCEKTFSYGSALYKHRRAVHTDKELCDDGSKSCLHQCNLCDQTFQYAAWLKQHRSHAHKDNRPYQCDLCDKGYFAKAHLKEHYVRAHSNTRNFTCLVCLKGFRTKSDCTRHRQTHEAKPHVKKSHLHVLQHAETHRSKAVRCNLCGSLHKPLPKPRRFNFYKRRRFWCSAVKRKVLQPKGSSSSTQKDTRLFQCTLCGCSFGKTSCFKRHLEVHAEGKELNFCSSCEKHFKTLSHLQRHKLIIHSARKSVDRVRDPPEEPTKCEKCQRTFQDRSSLVRHLTDDHMNKRSHSCEICGALFKTVWRLNAHKEQIHPDGRMKLFVCTVCNKKFRIRFLLRKHAESHLKKAALTCTLCDASFLAELCLLAHKCPRRVQPKSERNFMCDLCGKLLRSLRDLTNHQLAVHSNKRDFICERCGKRFKTGKCVEIHQRRTRCQEPQKYTCETCGKTYPRVGSLVLHRRCHREKQRTCKVCHKVFASANCLWYHMKSHLNVRPFACNVCPKRFYSNNLLKEHLNIHTGEKPFKCKTCGAAFTHRGTLHHHFRVHKKPKTSKKDTK